MLSFLPTPIGNLDDITLRTIKMLQDLRILFCEHTTTTKKLLTHLEIDWKNKQFLPFNSHISRLDRHYDLLVQEDVGVISDSGTPGLSDPGKTLIFYCQKKSIPYTILPGANALVPGLVGAGFPSHHFTFLGFLPIKKGRQTLIKDIVDHYRQPVFFFESVHRIVKTLSQFKEQGFVGKVSIAREISKLHEQYITDDIGVVIANITNKTIPLKGEFVVGLWKEERSC